VKYNQKQSPSMQAQPMRRSLLQARLGFKWIQNQAKYLFYPLQEDIYEECKNKK